MWNALIALVRKWAHIHHWKVLQDREVSVYASGFSSRPCGMILVYVLQCKDCGDIRVRQYKVKD